MYRWAASIRPTLINRIPIRCWPDAKRPAAYHGAREIEDAMVQTWATDAGTVRVLWSDPRGPWTWTTSTHLALTTSPELPPGWKN